MSERGKYDDIINLGHPTSKKHPRMPIRDRAAQFAPFSALVGYDEAVEETARVTDDMIEQSDEMMAILNEKLSLLKERIGSCPSIAVTYFIPDERKSGGRYVIVRGQLVKTNDFARTITLSDGKEIAFDKIFSIEEDKI